MCFLFGVMPTTIWAVVGYIVLFSSTKAQGGIRTFGQIPAIWLLIFAAVFPMAGAYAVLAGLWPIDAILDAIRTGANS